MIYLFKFMVHILKFIREAVFYFLEGMFWLFITVGILLYCLGYMLWFFKLPENPITKYNQIFDKAFHDLYDDVLKKQQAKQIEEPAFKKNKNPKEAMGTGEYLKGKLYRKFRILLGVASLLIFILVMLFILFLKVMLIILGVSLALFFIIMLCIAIID